MSQAGLTGFLAKLKSDERLRDQVARAEQEAAAKTQPMKDAIDTLARDNWESLRRIAEEHGFEISPDLTPPQNLPAPSEQELESVFCLLTCCWAFTSVWDGEGIPTVDGPGPAGTQTQFCS